MMIVELPSRKLAIDFAHPCKEVKIGRLRLKKDRLVDLVNTQRQSQCVLSTVKDGKPDLIIGMAVVKLFHKDRFKKEQGRKLALRRALALAGIGRDERRLIWQAYHDRPRKDMPSQKEKVH